MIRFLNLIKALFLIGIFCFVASCDADKHHFEDHPAAIARQKMVGRWDRISSSHRYVEDSLASETAHQNWIELFDDGLGRELVSFPFPDPTDTIREFSWYYEHAPERVIFDSHYMSNLPGQIPGDYLTIFDVKVNQESEQVWQHEIYSNPPDSFGIPPSRTIYVWKLNRIE